MGNPEDILVQLCAFTLRIDNGLSGAFSLISWLLMNQLRRDTYQITAMQ